MKRIALSKCLIIIGILISNLSEAQSPQIIGPSYVLPFDHDEFTFDYDQSVYTLISLEWQLNYASYSCITDNPINFTASPSCNNIVNSATKVELFVGNDQDISNFSDGMNTLELYVSYEFVDMDNITITGTSIKSVYVPGLDPSMFIIGPRSIQACCSNYRVYEVLSSGDADVFQWSMPNWSFSPINNGQKCQVTPSIDGNGQIIQVKATMSGVTPDYNVTVDINVNRTIPQINQNSVVYSPKPPYCPGTQVTISFDVVCGANGYLWDLPSGFEVVGERNSNRITFILPESISNSTSISVLPMLDGGCEALLMNLPIPIVEQVPNPLEFDNLNTFENYHCGNWYFCDAGGYLSVAPVSSISHFVEEYHWEVVSGQWGLGPQKSSTYITMNTASYSSLSNGNGVRITPLAGATTGVIKVTPKNCKGYGSSTLVTVYKDNSAWCQEHENYVHPYPIYCECCQPPGSDPEDPWYPVKIGRLPSTVKDNSKLTYVINGESVTLSSDRDMLNVEIISISGQRLWSSEGCHKKEYLVSLCYLNDVNQPFIIHVVYADLSEEVIKALIQL